MANNYNIILTEEPEIHAASIVVEHNTRPCLLINITTPAGSESDYKLREVYNTASSIAVLSIQDDSFESLQGVLCLLTHKFPFVKKVRLHDPCYRVFDETVDLLIIFLQNESLKEQ